MTRTHHELKFIEVHLVVSHISLLKAIQPLLKNRYIGKYATISQICHIRFRKRG